MLTKETVAAVVVTYNRKQLLAECLDALLAQTRMVDKIILIDNASTDGTQELLNQKGYLNIELIEYIRMPENTGGAGGFHEGVKRAYEGGFDWIWVMDDDAEPMKDALAIMSEHFSSNAVALANLTIGNDGIPQYQHRGWFDFCRTDDRIIREVTPSDIENLTVEIEFASFIGLAISRNAVSKIGYPKKEFFIHYDDNEYCARLRGVGRALMATRSIIKHKDAVKLTNGAICKSFMGRRSERIPLDKLWLSYYGARNRLWVKRQYGSLSSVSIYSIRWLTRKWLGILLYDDHKISRMWFYLNAISDGILGRFDNQKPKRLLMRGIKAEHNMENTK